jgi:hypothetical protein
VDNLWGRCRPHLLDICCESWYNLLTASDERGAIKMERCPDCAHDAHESWGCSDLNCGCETMWTLAQAEAQLLADSIEE